MAGDAVLALLNGAVIGTSRAVNGRLALAVGALRASLCNHVVGFFVLAATLAAMGNFTLAGLGVAPAVSWLGGVFGALFVAGNSHVLPRLGATQTAVLVISGQMIAGVALDMAVRQVVPTPLQLGGLCLVLTAVLAARR